MTNGRVDGVFGGPPCQGFSEIGKRQIDDPRRTLVGEFFRIVRELEPRFFVMENVKGLGQREGRILLDEAIGQLPSYYDVLGPINVDAADFGAATRRPRLFLIGTDSRFGDALRLSDFEAYKRAPSTVRDAIGDLDGARFIRDCEDLDLWKITKRGRPSLYAARLRSDDGTFTGHQLTVHSRDVIERFRGVIPGRTDVVGRHHKLNWDGQCPTLRAGTGNDRGSFQSVRPIHPKYPRVITVREAARLQGFPDYFRFHPTQWHSFRMIGNSVSPIAAHSVFSVLRQKADVHLDVGLVAAE